MNRQLIKEILEYLLEKLENGTNIFSIPDLVFRLKRERNIIIVAISEMLITEFIRAEVVDVDHFKLKSDIFDIVIKLRECKKLGFKLKNRNLL